MKVAYLVNQYPHVSHSFIRREIAALEKNGVTVARFSIRPSGLDLVDGADVVERAKTRVLLAAGPIAMLVASAAVAFTRPFAWLEALRAAIRLGRRSERGVLRHVFYLVEACLLVRWLRGTDAVDHLHAHFGTNPAAVALLTRMLGGPSYSFTVHGPEEFDHPGELSLGEKIGHAAAVVAVSDFGRSQLYRWISYAEWPKVRVVRCGVDAAFLAGGAQPPVDNRRFVCVGRLTEQKGQLLLLDAVAELAAQGIAIDLVLAGDGPMREPVERRIRELGLVGSVRITGWISNEVVRRELLDARALVLPSFAEGLPVVLMEALAMGRASISTFVAGIPELVEDGKNGWLVPAGSVDALVSAFKRALAASPAELASMGRAGAEAVSRRHDVDKEARILGQLFSEIALSPGALGTPKVAS